jgi:predicted Zn-dependent protease
MAEDTSANLQEYFHEVADALTSRLHGDEVHLTNFSAEDSEFVRFNRGAVRQAGSVSQRYLSVDLVAGRRHASGTITLTGTLESDAPRIDALLGDLREKRAALPDDPHLVYSEDVRSGTRERPSQLAEPAQVVDEVVRVSEGRDLVGVYAAGGIHAGFASSLGQRNWSATHSYNLDWSFHSKGESGESRAVKSSYAGFEWNPGELARRAAGAGEQLAALERPPRPVEPGRYRVYLAPGALRDIIDMLCWGGFGLRAHRTKATPLLKLIEGDATLHPSIRLRENTANGIAPPFEAAGFIRPDEVPLILGGAYAECLVSPRSSVEYEVPTNGAGSAESPHSIDMDGGALSQDAVLAELGDGLYVSNLWYLNYSDRPACRTTGMTRFATIWVENGRLGAPAPAARFDETIYNMLGANLVGLSSEREWILDENTYGRRSTGSARLPGALIDGFRITL